MLSCVAERSDVNSERSSASQHAMAHQGRLVLDGQHGRQPRADVDHLQLDALSGHELLPFLDLEVLLGNVPDAGLVWARSEAVRNVRGPDPSHLLPFGLDQGQELFK